MKLPLAILTLTTIFSLTTAVSAKADSLTPLQNGTVSAIQCARVLLSAHEQSRLSIAYTGVMLETLMERIDQNQSVSDLIQDCNDTLASGVIEPKLQMLTDRSKALVEKLIAPETYCIPTGVNAAAAIIGGFTAGVQFDRCKSSDGMRWLQVEGEAGVGAGGVAFITFDSPVYTQMTDDRINIVKTKLQYQADVGFFGAMGIKTDRLGSLIHWWKNREQNSVIAGVGAGLVVTVGGNLQLKAYQMSDDANIILQEVDLARTGRGAMNWSK